MEGGGSGGEEVWFEPFECNALEVGLCEGNFGMVCPKCPGVIREVYIGPGRPGVCEGWHRRTEGSQTLVQETETEEK